MVAAQIQADIAKGHWTLGEILGSETDLLQRYGVSRAVLREAVRLVEHSGAALMRRGPGGGLVVCEPDSDSAAITFDVWLSYVDVTLDELFDTLDPLMAHAVALLCRMSNEVRPDIANWLANAGDIATEIDMWSAMAGFADLTGDPVVGLFGNATWRALRDRFHSGHIVLRSTAKASYRKSFLVEFSGVAESIDSGRTIDAQRHMAAILATMARRLKNQRPGATRRSDPSEQSLKLAEQVAASLLAQIERSGWEVDSLVGSEIALTEQFDVSRSILREAIRLLEHHGAVRTKRGPSGGLLVAAPDASAIVRAFGLVLEFARVTPQQLVETRSALELAAVDLATRRITVDGTSTLEKSLERDRTGLRRDHYELHHQIAELSGARPLALLIRVLSELVDNHIVDPRTTLDLHSAIEEQATRIHRNIVNAIVGGDVDAAKRRMSRHLVAVLDVMA